jgi:uncharacterized membrane protein HdeD (DUF308 family)
VSNEQDVLSQYAPATNPARSWGWVLLGGLISIALGVIVMAWPDRTLLVLVVIAGIQLLVAGVFRMLFALGERSGEGTWVLFLIGVLGIIAGTFVMRQPSRTIQVFVVVVGLYWLLSGLIDIYQGIRDRNPDYAFVGIAGGVVTALGGVILLLWPDVTLLVLAVIVGLTLIVTGVVQAALALRLRATLRA